MKLRGMLVTVAAGMAFLGAGPAFADDDDYYENRANKVADCDKKLREAQSRREYYEKLEECDRELAKFDREWAEKRREERRKRRNERRYRDWDD
ncbi:MAG: hypothetical protein QNJ15_01215 [Erythrobacter sp.]|nr:hypothetical protein [Erythrobacter sp.]